MGMDRDGHFGFTLLVYFTTLQVLSIEGWEYVAMGLLAATLSFIPDLDLRLRVKHRGVTHSFITAFIVSLLGGLLTSHFGPGFSYGFIILFTAQGLHILGDMLTYTPLKPFYPLSHWRISLRLFKSDNRLVNRGLMLLGGLALTIYYFRLAGIDILALISR